PFYSSHTNIETSLFNHDFLTIHVNKYLFVRIFYLNQYNKEFKYYTQVVIKHSGQRYKKALKLAENLEEFL
ncbi:MAG: hypothetical protein FWF65_09830, partial [Bacteroidetes bacterium]|nr:hypothetical protein [Bacteroidota bacterium]